MCAEHAHAFEHDDLVPTALFSCLSAAVPWCLLESESDILAVVPVLNGERQEP